MSVRASLVIVSLAVLAGLSTDLFAHVTLSRAVPAAGSLVHGSPAEVELWFSATIEPAFSTLQVLDDHDQQVDKRDKRVDSARPNLLRVSLPPLAPGTYRVRWRAVSIDTHAIEGTFTFTVRP